ncbi:hypothetical protein HW555_002619 [Spodoptera exigua]|uniref:FAM20 C-terminal domain-containing protein n=1 Tax=Spodoptera exigua TaxID=7107 RepID=A0A835L7S1_SPOEX|nr:hypothetical protein HW555_002619 [Spodoptera exigua]
MKLYYTRVSSSFQWADEESLFPYKNGAAGQILQAMRTSQIAFVDNAPKGTQLKLLLVLKGNQKLYFKPKRYNLTDVIRGNIYAGYDRHNSEVFTYYLAMVLNYKWVAPSVIRRINMKYDILAHAMPGFKRTMVKNSQGSDCIYGKCYYCKINETVCPDSTGHIEGAGILYLDKYFKVNKSPWRRSYNSMKMEWENDKDYCKKVSSLLSTKRILNLIDIAIIDFLIQNGDRHRYEVYKHKILLLDNGKGLGNPMLDELDILAPLYQCCIISSKTWQMLELVSGGSLTETIQILASFQGEKLTTDDHYRAIERRLLKVYATVIIICLILSNILITGEEPQPLLCPTQDRMYGEQYGGKKVLKPIGILLKLWTLCYRTVPRPSVEHINKQSILQLGKMVKNYL